MAAAALTDRAHANAWIAATAAASAPGADATGAAATRPAVGPLLYVWDRLRRWWTGTDRGGVTGDSFGPVMRVNQLDAESLDSELTVMLSYQLTRTISAFGPDALHRFKPELDALLQALIFRFSVFRDVASPGNKLQNLRYQNAAATVAAADAALPALPPLAATSQGVIAAVTAAATAAAQSSSSSDAAAAAGAGAGALTAASAVAIGAVGAAARGASDALTARQKVLYAVLLIGGRWGWARVNRYLLHHGFGHFPDGDWHSRVYRAVRVAETLYRCAAALNFALFLLYGEYRSVVERVLRVRLVYAQPKTVRQVTFDFMNQQLMWNAVSEFALFALPLIDFNRLRALLRRVFRSEQPGAAPAPADASCPVCAALPIAVPFRAVPCGHVMCYYCVAGSRAADRAFRCPRCDARVTDQTAVTAADA